MTSNYYHLITLLRMEGGSSVMETWLVWSLEYEETRDSIQNLLLTNVKGTIWAEGPLII